MTRKLAIGVLILAVTLISNASLAADSSKDKPKISDQQIITAIIRNSIARYQGNCPCPYNLASNGSRCGKRSAYSRPGGYSPICYASDITEDMIKAYRDNHGL